jgi:PAS domain S-box-containing protein
MASAAVSDSATNGFFHVGKIALRTAFLSWVLISGTLGLFVFSMLTYQRNALVEGMASEACSIGSSVAEVTASAIINEDYGAVVEHCMGILKQSPSIRYIVITRSDGFSLIHTTRQWKVETLKGRWRYPPRASTGEGTFEDNGFVEERVFNLSTPFSYSGIDWGLIHVGLSLEKFDAAMKSLYTRTIGVALFCLWCGFVTSMYFGKKLTQPIDLLNQVTHRVAEGDLTVRAGIRSNDELGRLAASFDAMTEALQKSREAVVASKEYTDNIIRSLNEILMVVGSDGIIKLANQATLALTGYEESEVIGRRVKEIVGDEAQSWEQIVSRAAAGFVYNVETICRARGGREIPVLLSAARIRGSDGGAEGVVCAAMDITDRKRAEELLRQNQEELERRVRERTEELTSAYRALQVEVTERKEVEAAKRFLEAQLVEGEKMRAIGTLAGGIAHDFNNLLAGMQGRVSLMLLETDSGHPQHAHLTSMEEIIKRGAGLTRQLLGFARGGKYEVKAIDLNALIGRSLEMFGRTRKEILVKTHFAPSVWTVDADEGQMEQVLLNLLVNAWHAMPGGGALTVQTDNVHLDDVEVTPFDVAPGKYVRVVVVDTGHGMDEETKKRVFEPFFTTKEMGKGTGLGLASAYGIIRNHGGFITLESDMGKGSTFCFVLPASDKEVVPDGPRARKVKRGTETLLVVDDEDIVLMSGGKLLESLGYQVILAREGTEAVRQYEQLYQEVALVLLDMIMPGMGGGEVYDKLKQINPAVKVLLSSGYSLDGQAAEILRRGCDGFIQKPFRVEEFSQKIREVIDGR